MKVFSCEIKSSIDVADSLQDDEVAAAIGAVQHYLDQDARVAQLAAQKTPANTISPWLQSSREYGLSQTVESPRGKSRAKLWGSTLLALALSFCMQTARAQEGDYASDTTDSDGQLLAVLNKARTGGNNLISANRVRVCLVSGVSKIDLDTPDGASIYSLADGAIVAKTGTQSSFSLNLANATANGVARPKLALKGKTDRDRLQFLGGSDIRNVAYRPGVAPEDLSSIALPLKRELAKTSYTSDFSTDDSAAQFNPEQGYIVVPDSDGSGATPLVGINGKYYRGAVMLKPTSGSNTSMRVINVLDIEDYLLSVVPSEVPSRWPAEVLKAQAIAARSYVVANLNKHKVDGYDVKDTVEDQVYSGVQSENDETNQAVAQTKGMVLKHNNAVISAFFHSTSGGATEVAEAVWGKNLPYLKAVVDYDDESPHFTWKRPVSVSKLQSLFKTPGETLLGVFVVSRYPGDSKRVKSVMLVSDKSSRLVTGQELRRLFNLPSTQFSLFQQDLTYIFSGRGFGHGLGLSQWGAKALADRGYNAGQILSYYYKDVTIESLRGDAI